MLASPTLVFSTGPDPFQLLVNVATLSRASHAAIGLGDRLLHVYEKGVKFEPREHWFVRKRQRLIAEFQIVPDVSRGLAIAYSRVGEHYDYAGVFRLALRVAFSPLQHAIRSPADAHTCAAFVMLLDPESVMIPEWAAIDRSMVTPVDLLSAAEYGRSFRPTLAAREL